MKSNGQFSPDVQESRYLAALTEITSLLLRGAPRDEICEAIFEKLRSVLQLDAYFHFLITPDGTRLKLASSRGCPPERLSEVEFLDFHQAVCGTVAARRQPMHVPNIPECVNDMTRFLHSIGITCYTCHPLMSNGRLLGTFSFGTRSRTEYTAPELELIQLVCNQVAITTAWEIAQEQSSRTVLRESEERFRMIADKAPVLMWMSGEDKLCSYFNKSWLDFTGRPLEAEIGNGWADRVHPEELQRCLDTYTQSFDRREEFEMEYRLRRYDGEYRWLLDIGVPRFERNGCFVGYIGTAVDITDRRMAEEAISGVSRKLIETQEQERSRIGRELHDDVSQRLALLAMDVQQIQRDMPDRLRRRMDELYQKLFEISASIHTMSHELHASTLEHLGMVAAVRSFCREFGERHNADIDLKTNNLPPDLPSEISLCLFRVLQEALQNAAKHSGVRRFEVRLWGTKGEVHLKVRDSGVGFDTRAALTGGIGFISMRERLRLVQGELSINSQLSRGTTIHACVPISSSRQHAAAA